MSNNLQSLFQKIKIDTQTANSVYVYYDKKEGLIHKISSRKEESTYDILEIDRKEAKFFLTGEKKTSDYKVSYDIISKTIVITHINESNSLGTYDKILYQIPKNNDNADLVIEQNYKNNTWKVSIEDNTLSFIKTHGLSVYDKILLSVTKKDDPNILYRSMYIDIGKLIEKSIDIPFKFEFEFKHTDVSIYTNKYFETYSYKVVK